MGIVSKFLDGLFFPTIWKDGVKVVDAPQPIEFAGVAVSVATVNGRTVVTIGSVGGALPNPASGLLFNNAGLIGSSSWLAADVGGGVMAGLTNGSNLGYVKIGAGSSPASGLLRGGYVSLAGGGVTLVSVRMEGDSNDAPLLRWNVVEANFATLGSFSGGVERVACWDFRGTTLRLLVGGVQEFLFSATSADFFGNDLLNGGAIGCTSLVSSGVSHYAHARVTGVISPAQITANQNDYAPTGLASAAVLRLSSDAVRRITGLDSTGLSAGPVRTLMNVGSHPIVLSDQDTGSGTNNRFNLGGHDVVLLPDQAITLWLDVTGPNRWRPTGVADPYTPTHGVTLADADATLTADQGAVRRIPVLTANRTYDIDNNNAIDEEVVTLVRTGAEAFTATIRDHANATIATFPASQKLKGRFRKANGGNFVLVAGGFERIN